MTTKKIEEVFDKDKIDKELAVCFQEPNQFEKRIRLLKKIQALANWMDDNVEQMDLDGYNSFQKFKYVKGAQYRTMLRKGCREVGLIFKQNDSTVSPQEGNSGNPTMVMHCLQFLIDPDTGEFEQYVTATVGQDGTDKQLEKAKTQGIKSFVKTNFLISDGDADDNEGDSAYKSAKSEPAAPTIATPSKEELDELRTLIEEARTKLNDPDYAKSTMDKLDSNTLTVGAYKAAKFQLSKVK